MYAIIKTGAKQHRVAEGDVLSVEKLDGNKGDEVIFNEVLMLSNDKEVKIGKIKSEMTSTNKKLNADYTKEVVRLEGQNTELKNKSPIIP